MRRALVILVAILLFSGFISAKDNFIFTLSGNYHTIADDGYKDEFASKKIFPEGKIAFKLFGNIYLWGSVGYIRSAYDWDEWSNKGLVDPDVAVERTSKKMIYGGGIGYYAGYFSKDEFAIKLEAGFCSIKHNISTQANSASGNQLVREEERDESGIGFRGNLGFTYGIYKNVFTEASLGYIYASDKVDGETINLGGFRFALGLGISF